MERHECADQEGLVLLLEGEGKPVDDGALVFGGWNDKGMSCCCCWNVDRPPSCHPPGVKPDHAPHQDLQQLRDAVVVLRLKDEPVEDVVDGLADEGAVDHELAFGGAGGDGKKLEG